MSVGHKMGFVYYKSFKDGRLIYTANLYTFVYYKVKHKHVMLIYVRALYNN